MWKLFPYGEINLSPSVPLTCLLNCSVCSQLLSQWTLLSALILLLYTHTVNQSIDADLTLVSELDWAGTRTSRWEQTVTSQVMTSALVVMTSGEGGTL